MGMNGLTLECPSSPGVGVGIVLVVTVFVSFSVLMIL